jgi:hypothetical protein
VCELLEGRQQGLKTKVAAGWAPVPHIYNPSYPGSRDREDHGSKPAWQIVQETYLKKKKTQHKKGLVEWLKV